MSTRFKIWTTDRRLSFRLILVTCHLTTYRASRKRFFAIIFHYYLHYCGIFLACFLIIIVLTIISSLISILILRASWLAWCLYRIYQLNKSSCRCRCKWDVTIEYLTCAIFKKFIFLTDMCSFCWQKCEPRPELFFRLDIFSTFRSVHILISP